MATQAELLRLLSAAPIAGATGTLAAGGAYAGAVADIIANKSLQQKLGVNRMVPAVSQPEAIPRIASQLAFQQAVEKGQNISRGWIEGLPEEFDPSVAGQLRRVARGQQGFQVRPTEKPTVGSGVDTQLGEFLRQRPEGPMPIDQQALKTPPSPLDKPIAVREATEAPRLMAETPTNEQGFKSVLAEKALESKGPITLQQAEKFQTKQSEKEAIDLKGMFQGRKSIPQEEFAQKVKEQMPRVNVIEKKYSTEEELASQLRGEIPASEGGEAKFRQHIKEPVENYRELYITVPEQFENEGYKKIQEAEKQLEPLMKKKGNRSIYDAFNESEIKEWNRLMDIRLKTPYSTPDPNKRFNTPSAHQTGDPQADTNRIGHIFMGDVTSDKGRGLQLLEEQNDWEREGIEKGFGGMTPQDEARLKELKTKMKPFADGEVNTPQLNREESRELERLLQKSGGSVPNHPLLKNSRELNLKKFLQKAVEGDYEYITSVTGQQVADRYDLSKQINNVEAQKRGDKYTIRISDKEGNRHSIRGGEFISEKEMQENVGKDLANKIMQQEEGVKTDYSGLDLKIGGEWHKKRYDRDNWKTLEKLTGAKSEMIEAQMHPSDRAKLEKLEALEKRGTTSEGDAKILKELRSIQKQRAIIITPEIKEKIRKGLPLFAQAMKQRRVA